MPEKPEIVAPGQFCLKFYSVDCRWNRKDKFTYTTYCGSRRASHYIFYNNEHDLLLEFKEKVGLLMKPKKTVKRPKINQKNYEK